MNKIIKDQFRLQDKISLTLRVSYIASFLSLIIGLICLLYLDILEFVPYIFIGFAVVNLVNTWLYSKHQNLALTYNIFSILGFVGSIAITLLTGGINSPFIFVLAIIVFSGYATTRRYGAIYLYISLLVIVLIYLQDLTSVTFTRNVIPQGSQNLFALISVLFSVYLLGGVLGKNLLKAHHNLYKIKMDIEQQIREKETLLKEIHHRVKNNLQTVSSLLSLQSRSIPDKEMKKLIKSSQNRVISMAIVHEMLYNKEDLNRIEYKSYVNELANYLVRSVKGTDSKVKVKVDVPEIELGIDTAIPLGLLINEIVTNSLKYGLKDDEKGEIYIRLRNENEDQYILNIGDSGKGFPDNVTPANTTSLGLKLIHNLVRQLKGNVIRDKSKKGTHYIIKFHEIGHHEMDSIE